MGAEKQTKGGVGRRQRRQAPRWAPQQLVEPPTPGVCPRRVPAPQVQPVPRPTQPRGCKGRSPLHKKTKSLPLPRRGRGQGDRGKQSKLTAGAAGDQQGKPPAGHRNGWSSRQRRGYAPRRVPAPQVQPVPRPTQPRGCKGRSPLHKKTKNLPLPAREERSASAGWGSILPLRGRGAGK